jgi:hypothetical protein
MDMIQTYINHIALVVDKSGSMNHLESAVVKVFDNEIAHLRQRSLDLNQETRISVYLFGSEVECLVFDMDVMRMKSLAGYYRTTGMTALIDATLRSMDDMAKLPELYGDHAFLVYTLTDGEENRSAHTPRQLMDRVERLPDNWTIVCMVPDAKGLHEAKKFGFPPANTSVWSTTSGGMEQAGREFRSAMDSYMTARATGQRSTKAFFKVDLAGVSAREVAGTLQELSAREYQILNVRKDGPIREFVESWLKTPYVKGSAYYELTKPETVQAYKEVCIQHRANGKVYAGRQARSILGLPTTEIRVSPGDHGDWRIFIQSTSYNRNLAGGTFLLVRS